MISEKQLEAKCRKIAIADGCKLYKWSSPGQRSVPDRILIVPGIVARIKFVEFKSEKGRLTKLQKATITELARIGCEVHVVRCVEEFRELL